MILTMTTKNSKLWFILRVFEVSLQALVFYIVLFMLSYHFIMEVSKGTLKCFLLAVLPVLLLYLARMLITNNALIIMIHMGVAVFYIAYGKTAEEKLAYLLLGVALIVFSLSLSGVHRKDGSEKIPIGFVCLFVLAIMLGKNAELDSLVKAGVYGGSIFIVLQILYMNFDQVNKFIRMNQEIAGLPIRQIVSVNTFQMFLLVVLFFGVIFLFCNSYVNIMVEALCQLIGGGVKYVLRFIFSIGKDWKSDGYVPTPNPEERGLMELQALMEESIWTDILNGIGMLMGSLLGMILLIGLCVGIIVIVSKKFRVMSFGAENDIKEFVIPRDFAEFHIRHSKKDKREKGTGTNVRVRKLYKVHVKKAAAQRRAVIDKTLMPYEISKLYVQNHAGQVTDIYEKARYSDETITQEEMIRLKQELK